MAVYTEVSDDELAAFLARFDIAPVTAFKGIAEGVENSNYLLQTTGPAYFLTLYEKRVRENDLPYFIALLRHMAAKGIECPAPVADRGGQAVHTLCGKPAAIMTFLPGLSPRRPAVAQCALLGNALARLHLAGADFPERRANSLSVPGWRKLAQATERQANQVHMGLSAIVAAEISALGGMWPAGLPFGVIHADLFPDNVLFTGDRISGLIDFYFACDDFLAYDVAVCLNAWCFEPDGSFNIIKGQALLGQYCKARLLSGVELDALPILARGAALRFLLTRLYDWLNRDAHALVRPKDPLEYLAKLRFHQRVRSHSDYGTI
jgi:homoserine kinase type II